MTTISANWNEALDAAAASDLHFNDYLRLHQTISLRVAVYVCMEYQIARMLLILIEKAIPGHAV